MAYDNFSRNGMVIVKKNLDEVLPGGKMRDIHLLHVRQMVVLFENKLSSCIINPNLAHVFPFDVEHVMSWIREKLNIG